MTKYLFRVDDVAEEMSNWGNFERLCKVFRKYKVKPVIAVIPDNKDPEIKGAKKKGWIKMLKGFTIGMHGCYHLKTGNGGMLDLFKYGEFGGVGYLDQRAMLNHGKDILEKKFKKKINLFVAPWHSFDLNTVQSLSKLGFEYVHDGFFINPIDFGSIKLIPVADWKISKKFRGTRTLTMHVQDITLEKISNIENFIVENRDDIIDVDSLTYVSQMTWMDKFYQIYFNFRYSRFSPLYQIVRWLKNAKKN